MLYGKWFDFEDILREILNLNRSHRIFPFRTCLFEYVFTT